jgi:hypothetical protein
LRKEAIRVSSEYVGSGERSGITTIICSIAIVVVVFVTQYFAIAGMYSSKDNVVITEYRMRMLNNASVPTFLVILFSLALAFYGVRILLKSWKKRYFKASSGTRISSANPNNKLGLRTIIAESLSNTLCQKIFWAIMSFYIIMFLLTSNGIVYRPGSSFSHSYGVAIPSFHIIGCCGVPGSFPVITIYATDELGFLFVPSNIIIASFLSPLVGTNFAIIVYRMRFYGPSSPHMLSCNVKNKQEKENIEKKSVGLIKKRPNPLTGFGLLIGLFAGCPACGGNILLSTFIGYGAIAGTTATTAAGGLSSMAIYSIIGQYQPIFITISFIALIAGPVLMSRR